MQDTSAVARRVDVAVIGGGQAGLALGYYLRRAGLSFVILDQQSHPGGAWQHTWPSLRLFSPAQYSSLPGRLMPPSAVENPDAGHVIDYLSDYEDRYNLPVERPVEVAHVVSGQTGFTVVTDSGDWGAPVVVNATGTWSQPFWPSVPGQAAFRGTQSHSADYRGPGQFVNKSVLVIGGANSGAQIAADLVDSAEVTWCLRGEPRYLPDDVDGRELFRVATRQVQARAAGEPDPGGVASLGDIVAVPPVKEARDAGLLIASPMFERFTAEGVTWPDGSARRIDSAIWCTGFRPALRHLRGLDIREQDGTISLSGTESTRYPGMYFVGYGDWTGPGSATLIGVGATAKATVDSIGHHLH
ncbi:ArsO family NAD(P)H-dependent flavin-containing monooxygenase [Brevibacterium spongiae]|uniref:ArsO family NAD(P)H-dependent flavin-containing monooxygenase n=1 Tax=Brevibacterium spongiae TaxID=2909672 RepID=A0ABY5SU43_9MICO|nr:ArsO family NAD(P)H-dependent flavin-containing monooxygenase [Brevibacterium spongiae]UVI36229.1 ArsO family NAD(P)H-dependent flavin-containing monooxygenase [Brevibacterium spongiae]